MIRTATFPAIAGIFEGGDEIGSMEPVEGIGKKLKKLGRKAEKLGKKALPVAALVANVIPGVGPVISAGLAAGAVAVKQRQAKKRNKRAAQAMNGEMAEGDLTSQGYSAQVLPGGGQPLGLPGNEWGGQGDEPYGPAPAAPASGGVAGFLSSPMGLATVGGGLLALVLVLRK